MATALRRQVLGEIDQVRTVPPLDELTRNETIGAMPASAVVRPPTNPSGYAAIVEVR